MNLFLCICLLTVACNHEIHHILKIWLFVVKSDFVFGSGSGSKFNIADQVVSGRDGLSQMISGMGRVWPSV